MFLLPCCSTRLLFFSPPRTSFKQIIVVKKMLNGSFLQTMWKRSGTGWRVCEPVCLSVRGSVTLPSIHGCVVDFSVASAMGDLFMKLIRLGIPRLPRCCRWQLHFLHKNEENTGAVSQEVCADLPLIMSYHCVNIFTRDYVWGLGAIHFVFDWSPHLVYISFFLLYPSITLVGNKPPTGWEN